MDITIIPSLLRGEIAAVPSKSQAHRLLICAAFSDQPTRLLCSQTSADIEATAGCLRALGAEIDRTGEGYLVNPISAIPESALLHCRESGSTLRFFLPIVGALGVDATFETEGRLPKRPLSPLWEEMERMGCRLSRPSDTTIRCTGQLKPGAYSIDGGVSSQFITGLLFALSLLKDSSTLALTGKIESAPYIQMTLRALESFGVTIPEHECYSIIPQVFRSPGTLTVEGDWSNSAFWLAAKALGSDLRVSNLDPDSSQGDRAVVGFLSSLKKNTVIDAAQTPDLVPILAVAAAAKQGATFTNCGRLRHKETDRLATTAALINSLGGKAEIQGDSLVVQGTGLVGGTVDATGDHRIAMAAAIASTACTESVTILGAESVSKSYPAFWDDFKLLGGKL